MEKIKRAKNNSTTVVSLMYKSNNEHHFFFQTICFTSVQLDTELFNDKKDILMWLANVSNMRFIIINYRMLFDLKIITSYTNISAFPRGIQSKRERERDDLS